MSSIIYPLFEECRNYTLDPYWREQFTNFACNKFPQGMRYDQTHRNIILKIDGKTEVIALPEDNAAETFQIVLNILKTRLNLRSTRDLKVQKQAFDQLLEDQKAQRNEDISSGEWKKIKPKHLKDQLLMDYIASLKVKYSLTPLEIKHLISKVQLGFQFRSLSADDVEFDGTSVVNIKGLDFSSKTRTFTTPEYAPASRTISKSEKAGQKEIFYTSIEKFFKENNNRLGKIRG